MTRSSRLQPVKRLANEKADAAARQFAERRRDHGEQQERLRQLENFRLEYSERLRSSGEAGIDGFRLRDYNAFIARIDAAIEQQRQTLHRSEQELEQSRTQWMQVLGRSRALDKVVERVGQEEARADEKRLQRMSDELTQLRFRAPRDEE